MTTHDRAIILNDLANSYALELRYTKAIERYKEALSLYIYLAEKQPVAYGLAIAHVFSNMSMIYFNLKRKEESDALHQNALKMHRVLTKYNPNKYGIELAQCIVDGVLYLKQHPFTLYEAEIVVNQISTSSNDREDLVNAIRKLHESSLAL